LSKVKKKGGSLLPKLKKDISSFAKGESGKISKQSMLTVGAIVGGAAVGVALSSRTVKGGHAWIFRSARGAGITPSGTSEGGVFGSGTGTVSGDANATGDNIITYTKVGDGYNITVTVDTATGKVSSNKSY
jgi:hypothetical protein